MTHTAPLVDSIAANAQTVRNRIASACARAGRDPREVRLIAVSKTFPMDTVRAAITAGLTDFGENRVQEALDKVAQSTGLDVTWHLIGHLQSNKARRAVDAMAWIHSVDSVALLTRLERTAHEEHTSVRALVQVDLAGEAAKHGASIDETREIIAAGQDCRSIQLRGLMVLPPWSTDPEMARPYFRRLAGLRRELIESGAPPSMLTELSMGMSHDFEVAVEEGATMVRVGTAIFGPRSSRPA